MKKTFLFTLFIILSIDIYAQFRETKWGDTIEEVKKSESGNYIGQNEISGMQVIIYDGTVANIDTQIAFFFIDNELVRGGYVFTEIYLSTGQYVEDYRKVKRIITSVYGDPKTDRKNWNNETMKEYSDEVTAISLGHLSLISAWETEDTKIGMTLASKSFKTEHVILYESILHKDKIESLNNKQVISDF